MQFRKTWGVAGLALLAMLVMAPAARAASEIEGFLVWYFPSTLELEPTNHPLAVEQREGIDAHRLAEVATVCGG